MEFFTQNNRDFTRNTNDRVAVGTVGQNREINQHVIHSQNVPHIGTGLPVAFQNQNAVNLCAGIIPFFQAEFLTGTHHAVRRQATKFTTLDMNAIGQMRVVQCTGNQRTFKNVLCTGDDLDFLFSADIDLAYPELVCVGMVFHLHDTADDDIAHSCGKVDHLLDLESAHCHFIAKDLRRYVNINIAFQPIQRYFHFTCLPFLLLTVPGTDRGTAGRSQTAAGYR